MRTDKCVDNRGKDRDGDRLSDSPKTSQMEIGGMSEVGDMISEGKGAIKSDTEVTDGG